MRTDVSSPPEYASTIFSVMVLLPRFLDSVFPVTSRRVLLNFATFL